MSNTLTGLIPTLYANLDVVSRELVGYINSVGREASVERAALNQTVKVYQTRNYASQSLVAGVTPPDTGDQTLDSVDIVIDKAKFVPFRWNGEEQKGLGNNGPGYKPIMSDQIQQAFRTLTNEIELDLATIAGVGFSRAYGTAGSDPFATTVGESAQSRKILDDNGAPASGRSLIINTSAGASLRTLSNLTKANEAGTTMTLRDGQLLDLNGLSIKESGQITRPAIGTSNNSGTTDTAGYAVGATAITMAAAGTGTILAGDIVTIAGDTANKYVVATGVASLAAGGVLTLQKPGLMQAIPTSAKVVTVVAISSRNTFFTPNAIQLACRLPALPDGGDLATDRTTIVDPRSGIAFEIAFYPQFRQSQYIIAATWGKKVIKPEHGGVLIGA